MSAEICVEMWVDARRGGARRRRNVLLADEMGLGKTAQVVAALATLRESHPRGPSLVVAPLSTIGHWSREFATWTDLRVLTLHGSADDRKVMLKHMWHAPAAGGGGGGGGKRGKRGGGGYLFHVVVTTYETLLLEASSLGSVRWNYAIVDEAQRLKNLESRARAAVEELRYEQVALLTGTPVQNCTAELFSLLNLLEPNKFADADDFDQRFGDVTTPEQARRRLLRRRWALLPWLLS